MPSIARAITLFFPNEAAELFKHARTKLKVAGLEIKLAPAAKAFGRILIVTPKRSGNAVQRNRIRRRLKSIFYQERLFEHGQDCIVLVSKQAIGLPFDELKALLRRAYV